MTNSSGPTRPIRQFRVTLTEDREGNVTHAQLAWRTFPCAATRWDGQRWYTFPAYASEPVTSVDALRGLLLALGEGPWYEARYPRQ